MTYKIRINGPEDAQKLNAIATKYPQDIWIHGKQGTADAKSLLGLMLMTMENNVLLVCEDSLDDKQIRKDFAQFIAD